ncbi:MAG: MEDS domain-containing protein, partial [Ilumatobacteraceae bacterium]
MRSTSRQALLGGQSLGEQRHLCVLSNGEPEFNEAVLRFISEGVALGERAICIVAPGAEIQAQNRLADIGLDTAAATSAGLLTTMGWDEGLLQQGPFSQSVAFAYVRQLLADSRADGFPRTRYLADMGWTLDQRVSLPDLVTYEGRLDQLARRIPDAIVCDYDVTRHSAGTISAVLAVHALVFVGGEIT